MVEEYNVIDTAGKSPNGRVGLMMFEHRDWTDIARQITDLRSSQGSQFRLFLQNKDIANLSSRPS